MTLRAVAFGQGEWAEDLTELQGHIDIAYRPVINEFRGRRSVELQMVDWRPSAVTESDFTLLGRGSNLSSLSEGRGDILLCFRLHGPAATRFRIR